jgi:hypothetical protein
MMKAWRLILLAAGFFSLGSGCSPGLVHDPSVAASVAGPEISVDEVRLDFRSFGTIHGDQYLCFARSNEYRKQT